MIRLLRKIFGSETDKRVDRIFENDIRKPLQESTKAGDDLSALLKKNGDDVSLRVYIAIGGNKHGH